MTADPAALREDFDAMAKASIASLRQWRFDPPASAPAVVRVPIYFDVVGGRTSFGSIRPMSGYPPHVIAVPPSDALKVGDAIKTPKKLVNVPPRYPDDALQAKVQGEVVLDVVVDANGVPTDVQVSQSVPMLDAAAIEAVRQWRYEPTLMNGVAGAGGDDRHARFHPRPAASRVGVSEGASRPGSSPRSRTRR